MHDVAQEYCSEPTRNATPQNRVKQVIIIIIRSEGSTRHRAGVGAG